MSKADEEVLAELRTLWKKRKAFLMQMEVGALYDGCFYEPNLFLVTPPGSPEQRQRRSSRCCNRRIS